MSEAGRQQLSEAGGRCPCCGAPRLHPRNLYPQAGTCSSPAGLLTLALEVGDCARLEVAEVPGCDEGAAGAVGARDLGAKQLPIRGLHKCGHEIHCRTAAGAAGSAGSARLSSLQRARTGLGDARLSRPWGGVVVSGEGVVAMLEFRTAPADWKQQLTCCCWSLGGWPRPGPRMGRFGLWPRRWRPRLWLRWWQLWPWRRWTWLWPRRWGLWLGRRQGPGAWPRWRRALVWQRWGRDLFWQGWRRRGFGTRQRGWREGRAWRRGARHWRRTRARAGAGLRLWEGGGAGPRWWWWWQRARAGQRRRVQPREWWRRAWLQQWAV